MFKKIVSYLAYSPSLMWQLSTNANKIKKEQEKTNWIIFFAIVSIALVLIASLIAPIRTESYNYRISHDQSTETNFKGLTLSHIILLQDNNTLPVEASQKVTYELVAKNTTLNSFSGKIYIDNRDVSEYFILLPETNPIISNEGNQLVWNVNNLSSNASIKIKLLMQSKNSFSFNLQSGLSNDCVASFTFGNTTHTEINCGPLKQVEKKLYQLDDPSSIKILLLLSLILIIAIKLAYQLENHTVLKETKLVRNLVNRGKL